jgi:hypothetical protein
MYFDFIIGSVTDHPTVAAGVAASAIFTLAFRTMISAMQRTGVRTENGLAAQFQEIETTLEQLRETVGQMTTQAPTAGPFDQARRMRAVAMLERGNSPESVASALGAPRSEVELLLKVHRIVGQQAS